SLATLRLPIAIALDERLCRLAVLLGFVMLLAILHQPSAALRRLIFPIAGKALFARFLVRPLLELLDEALVCLVALLSIRVIIAVLSIRHRILLSVNPFARVARGAD